MKNILLIFISFVLAFQLNAQQKASRFTIKSGMVEYKLTGNTKGTKTFYFDDYGDKTREHEKSVTETKIMGHTDRSETDKIVIINDGKYWSMDNLSGENYRGSVPYYKANKEIVEQMSEAEQKKLADDILHSFGGERQGIENVLGKPCEKITVMGAFSWIYKGVVLKSESKVMGIVANETATKFDENISIPANKFIPPSGLTFTDVEKMQQAYLSQMSETMEDYEEYDEENQYDDIHPLDFPFPQFAAAMESFIPEGYSKTFVTTQDGQHIAIFNQGLTNIISVVATSSDNMENDEEFDQFQTFSHGGKTLRYGDLSEEDMSGKALIIPYSEHNMYIILLAAPGLEKDAMVNMADGLSF
jgi:hypothetical protein